MADTHHELNPGDKMPDGTVYAGPSPETGRPLYAAPADAPRTHTYDAAQEYAAGLDAHGHKDWRLPTAGELNVLFTNRLAIGAFDLGGSEKSGWYVTSEAFDETYALGQRFSDGYQGTEFKALPASVRCVRG
jgi:hypothetical protein